MVARCLSIITVTWATCKFACSKPHSQGLASLSCALKLSSQNLSWCNTLNVQE